MRILHFTAKWCPFCPASERAFAQFRDKHPRVEAELIDVDEQPDLANRHHVDAVPTDLILGGARPLQGACYTLEEFEVLWRKATEKEKPMPAAKKTAAKKTVAKKAPAKKVAAKKAPAKKAPAKKAAKKK